MSTLPLKRSASPILRPQISSLSSSVTLHTLEAHAGPSTPRRSKRPRTNETRSANDQADSIPDVEDLVTPRKNKKYSGVGSTPKTPKTPKPIQQILAKPHPAPEKWRETYESIKAMRATMVAPVDTMGCDQAQILESDPKVRCHRHCFYVSLLKYC